jgi:hypothetical protein
MFELPEYWPHLYGLAMDPHWKARVHCRDIGTYRHADTMCILEHLSRGQGKSPVVRARWSLVYAYESQLVAALSQSRCLVSIACKCG